MSQLLRLDASSRLTDSYSRRLGDVFEHSFMAGNMRDRVIRRDLVATPVPHIQQMTIAGFYTPPEAMTVELRTATALSDQLINELLAAEQLLITTPMYNFSLPSALKAWIDQVVRIGRTFAYDGKSFTGLVKAKRATIICAYGAGGYLHGGPFADADFVDPYLKFLLGFLGIAAVEVIGIEATTGDATALAMQEATVRLRVEAAAKAARSV